MLLLLIIIIFIIIIIIAIKTNCLTINEKEDIHFLSLKDKPENTIDELFYYFAFLI